MLIVVLERPKQCHIPMDQLEDHFRSTYGQPVDISSPPPQWLHQSSQSEDVMDHTIQPLEVKAQLRRLPPKSSPGPDSVGYGSWKWLDWTGDLLATIFEICRCNCRIPEQWKSSATILIHKKGDEDVVTNWRPISLQNTLYKIYAALIAKRLATWALDTGAFSPSQKGFLPFEGGSEQNFLLRSAFQDAKHKKKITAVWLDLKDAFGSVPHTVLLSAMEVVYPLAAVHHCPDCDVVYNLHPSLLRHLKNNIRSLHRLPGSVDRAERPSPRRSS